MKTLIRAWAILLYFFVIWFFALEVNNWLEFGYFVFTQLLLPAAFDEVKHQSYDGVLKWMKEEDESTTFLLSVTDPSVVEKDELLIKVVKGDDEDGD